MRREVTCPKCHEVLIVLIPLGSSIHRTLDKALIEHNQIEHSEEA